MTTPSEQSAVRVHLYLGSNEHMAALKQLEAQSKKSVASLLTACVSVERWANRSATAEGSSFFLYSEKQLLGRLALPHALDIEFLPSDPQFVAEPTEMEVAFNAEASAYAEVLALSDGKGLTVIDYLSRCLAVDRYLRSLSDKRLIRNAPEGRWELLAPTSLTV